MLNAVATHEKLKGKAHTFGLYFWNVGMNSADELVAEITALFGTPVGAMTNLLFFICIIVICVFTIVVTDWETFSDVGVTNSRLQVRNQSV